MVKTFKEVSGLCDVCGDNGKERDSGAKGAYSAGKKSSGVPAAVKGSENVLFGQLLSFQRPKQQPLIAIGSADTPFLFPTLISQISVRYPADRRLTFLHRTRFTSKHYGEPYS